MESLYRCDLAYVHAAAFGTLARSAANEIVRRLRSSGTTIRRVMDVGCGAGPLTAALINAGFDVTGIDTSAELLKLARANVPTAHFVHASAYEVQIQGYDAVVALGEPLTYHARDTDADSLLNGFFQRVAEALPTGGMLIFDVIGLGEPSLAGRTWHSGDDWAVLVETIENQTERTLVRNIETFRRIGEVYRRSHEVHRVRLLMSRDCAINSRIAGSRPKQPSPMPPSRFLLAGTPSLPGDWLPPVASSAAPIRRFTDSVTGLRGTDCSAMVKSLEATLGLGADTGSRRVICIEWY